MPIVSSTFALGPVQKDGRHYVLETHVDTDGVTHRFEYLANSGINYTEAMNIRATVISDYLAADEAEAILNGS